MQGSARNPEENSRPLKGEPQSLERDLQRAAGHADVLLEIIDIVASTSTVTELFDQLAPLLQQLTQCDLVNLAIYDAAQNRIAAHLLRTGEKTRTLLNFTVDQSACGWVWRQQTALNIADLAEESRFPQTVQALRSAGIRSYSVLPLKGWTGRYGALGIGRKEPGESGSRELDLLESVAQLVGMAVENRDLQHEREEKKEALQRARLESERGDDWRDEIVGTSAALKRVLDAARIVAGTDATVLISGETGTGKERIARAIHQMSERREGSFIKLNCAAIPTGLLESELFGHEKGAFTGAVSQKIGRLELADNGTLFLDEIGEIALELQPKLLRVLQDQEFERLGSTKTIRVNVRLVAASNRDLPRAVEQKLFRSDLFYRLHVFPLHVPSLRERREDIPLLVRHFVHKYAKRMKKRIDLIPDEAIEVMMNWRWPGNIRELENLIERMVILTDGNRLRVPLDELRHEAEQGIVATSSATLRDREREHILQILRESQGVLGGPSGAAARLGIKRTTLQYKIKKLGILRREYS